jgi:murein DD-endopeptidase MepM/ murein hydrolase activator NlpD
MLTWKNTLRPAFFWLMFHALVAGGLPSRPASAANFSPVTLTAPETVAVGSPFLVRLSSPGKLERVAITWKKQRIRPAIARLSSTSKVLAMLGVGMNAKPGLYPLTLRADVDGKTRFYRKQIKVVDKKFQREALSVAPAMNTPPEKVLKRIKRELSAMKAALRTVSSQRQWEIPFHRPVNGVMLSRFGLRRTFNNETRRRHTGLDFRAPEGTAVAAIAAGRVVLVGDFYLPGNTVVIDHGNGVVSMVMHLSEILVTEGEQVKCGQVLGRAGATGRVTGAHLHLSVSVQGVAVDPAPLFEMDNLTGPAAALRSESML